LTDYVFAMTLQQAYQDRMDAGLQGAGYAGGGQASLTPDVKQAVADEVHRQLDLERIEGQNAGSGDISSIFSDNIPHVFVVSSSLMVDDRGPGCPVSEGDVLQLRPGSSNGDSADVVVLASKGGDCRRGGVVAVQLQDLQEMQNHMRETIDQGLKDLQDKQGTGGLPAAPASAQAAPAAAQYASVAPPPESNLAADIQAQDQQADQSEKEVNAEASQDSGAPAGAAAAAPAAPASVELGQTTDQVQSALGQPTRIANLGPKVIYYYNGMKVTFKDGKVSDVQ
jgi:hypothetical protein